MGPPHVNHRIKLKKTLIQFDNCDVPFVYEWQMNTKNGQLVAAIVGGETQRYAELVKRFEERIRRAICRMVNDPATSDDLVQETFFRAFVKLNDLQEPERLESWLVMIAQNCVTDHLRKSKRQHDSEWACGRRKANDRLLHHFDHQNRSWVWQEVDELAPKFSLVLRLRYCSNMSYREIALELGIPESTVRGRVFEARKALGRRLTDKGLFP